MSNEGECDICHRDHSDKVWYVFRDNPVCMLCYNLIFKIAQQAVKESMRGHEACGGTVVSTPKELNKTQEELNKFQRSWCGIMADEIMLLIACYGSDIPRKHILSRLEETMADPRSPFNKD